VLKAEPNKVYPNKITKLTRKNTEKKQGFFSTQKKSRAFSACYVFFFKKI